jgi:hypothetical protein
MAGATYGAWRNQEADRLQGQAESIGVRRKEIYWKFQELIREEELSSSTSIHGRLT